MVFQTLENRQHRAVISKGRKTKEVNFNCPLLGLERDFTGHCVVREKPKLSPMVSELKSWSSEFKRPRQIDFEGENIGRTLKFLRQ